MRKIKIFYLSIVDISLPNGQGIYAKKTLEALLKNNKNTQVFIPKPKNSCNIEYSENGEFIYLPSKKQNRDFFWHLRLQYQLFILIVKKVTKSDIIIYSNKPSMFSISFLKKIIKFRTYVLVEGLSIKTINSVIPFIFRKIGLNILLKNIKQAEICFPAYQSAQNWVNQYNTNTILYPCGVDTKVFQPRESAIDVKTFTIGYIGSFRKVHFVKELIDATRDLPVKLKLIGEGKELPQLKKYVETNNFIANVEFINSTPQEKLSELISDCHIMWGITDPNHWGLPIKVIEYLACNKKVIYTNRLDHKFIEKNNWGIAFNNIHRESLILCFKELLAQYKSGNWADNQGSHEYIAKYYNWENYLYHIKEIPIV